MPARKTELAHQALARHDTTLALRQRRVLILCDGRRTTGERTRMLGAGTPALLLQLCDGGYLEGLDAPVVVRGPTPAAERATHRGETPAPLDAPGRRRSLGAARIHVQGILELQRAPAPGALRARLVGASSEAATIDALLEAILGLPDFTKPGFAGRLRERVAEVLPEPHLPALAALVLRGEADAMA